MLYAGYAGVEEAMTEADLKMLKAQFELLRRECNTREKAIAQ
jgi:hypothetical protein